MSKKLAKKPRVTGVAVRMERLRASVRALVEYLLDLLKNQEKLYCSPSFQRIQQPAAKASPREQSRFLTSQIWQSLEWLQGNRCPVVEITISLAPGQSWSPRQWKTFWRHFLRHLSKLTYVTDHCVRRKPLLDAAGQPILGKHGRPRMIRERAPQLVPVDLSKYMAIVPVHDNTASQHLQGVLILRDPALRQEAVINNNFYRVAAQWAAREAERDLELTPHPNMPQFVLRRERNRCYVLDPEANKVKRHTSALDARRPVKNKPHASTSKKSLLQRRELAALMRLRAALAECGPESFPKIDALHRSLETERGCLRRSAKSNDFDFYIDGRCIPAAELGTDYWTPETILRRWPELADETAVVGMAPETQVVEATTAQTNRLKVAGIAHAVPGQQELDAIIARAQMVVEALPWNRFSIEVRRQDGAAERFAEMTRSKLLEKIRDWCSPGRPRLDQTLHFRPGSRPEILPVPLWRLSKPDLDRLQSRHQVALVSESQPGCFDALILVSTFPGESWKHKRALRRLTGWLARRYRAQPDVVSGDGVPLPGLPQLAGTGHCGTVIGEVRDIVCPAASRTLAKFGEKLETLERSWWAGAPGYVLKQIKAKKLFVAGLNRIYLESVKALADNPYRCATLEEMNARIAARMLGQRFPADFIQKVFEGVKKVWPAIVTEHPLAILGRAREYPVNFLRDPRQFMELHVRSGFLKPPVPLPPPPPVPMPPIPPAIPHPSPKPVAPTRPIAPDFVYDAEPIPAEPVSLFIKQSVDQFSAATRKILGALLKTTKRRPRLDQAALVDGARKHAKLCLESILAIDEQIRLEKRRAWEVTKGEESKLIGSPSLPSRIPSPLSQQALPPRAVRETPKSAQPEPKETQITAHPLSCEPVEPGETPDVRRRRKEKEERRAKLESLAVLMRDVEGMADQLQVLGLPEIQTALITRMVRAELREPNEIRLRELHDWIAGKEEAPGWFDAEFERHWSELKAELRVYARELGPGH